MSGTRWNGDAVDRLTYYSIRISQSTMNTVGPIWNMERRGVQGGQTIEGDLDRPGNGGMRPGRNVFVTYLSNVRAWPERLGGYLDHLCLTTTQPHSRTAIGEELRALRMMEDAVFYQSFHDDLSQPISQKPSLSQSIAPKGQWNLTPLLVAPFQN